MVLEDRFFVLLHSGCRVFFSSMRCVRASFLKRALLASTLPPAACRVHRCSFAGPTSNPPVRSVESMRQLAAQLADAERVAREAEASLASHANGVVRTPTGHENSMLSDMHGRHHNYLRISLTER